MLTLILPVPHLTQCQAGECLAACAAMLLTYLGQTPNYHQVVKLLRIRPGLGAPASNIRNLKKLGVTVTYQQGNLTELSAHLANNQPCLALVQTDDLLYWTESTQHALVVVGVDPAAVYLNDPAFTAAPLQVSRGDFELAWLAQDEYYAVFTPAL